MNRKKNYLQPAMKMTELRHKPVMVPASPGDFPENRQQKLQNYNWHTVNPE